MSNNLNNSHSSHSQHNTRVSYGSGSGSNSINEISFDEQNEIVRNFPSTIKFSYERSTHKKVLSDIFVIIPKGKKYFVWFTHRNRKNICIFLEIGYQNKIMNVFYRHVSFDDVLSYGTIFYGTLFRTKRDASSCSNNGEIFSVEDIFYYKGDDISEYIYEKKLKVIKNIFDTKLRYNISFFKNGVVFGLPVITTDFVDALDKADKLPYSVYSIQYRYLGYKQDNNNNDNNSNKSLIEFYHFNTGNGGGGGGGGSSNSSVSVIIDTTPNVVGVITTPATAATIPIIEKNEIIKQKPSSSSSTSSYSSSSNEIYKLFNIKPDLQNDVYYLYPNTTTNFATISKEIAHIPDYKTSVLMNKLFRNIKENINLDSLEESDEEEEFENIQIDKFVDLNKTIKMRCIFNYKFKKWVPVSVI
uniref:Uncharacterized protein n=1 Tax=viral metagenome TaxID=1070528 RepID=A0A6C0EXC1_9ZZZZ